MDFIEVPAADTPEAVLSRLIGSREQALNAESIGTAPGALGTLGPTLVFLSMLEGMSLGLAQVIHEIVTARRYTDLAGRRWRISDDLWMVGSYTYSRAALIAPDHWLISAFERRFEIRAANEPDEIVVIADSIASQLGGSLLLDDAAKAIIGTVIGTNTQLHLLRRLLEIAVEQSNGEAIGTVQLRRALVESSAWLLARVPYQGREIELSLFERWLDQFPDELRPVASHLVRQIAERYYIGQQDYFLAIDWLLRTAAIGRGALVSLSLIHI